MAVLQLLPADTPASQSRAKIDVARLQRALASGDHELPNGLSIEQMRERILAVASQAKR